MFGGGVYTAFVSNEEDMAMPLGAREVSGPSPFAQFDGDNWRSAGYAYQLPGGAGQQQQQQQQQQQFGQSTLGPFVAVGNGAYMMNVAPDPPGMSRFGSLDYGGGGTTFPSLGRTHLSSPDDYLYSRQRHWRYDDDRDRPWDSRDYRLHADDGPPPPIHTSTWPLYDEHRTHHRPLYRDLGDSSGDLAPASRSTGEVREPKSENKFRRLFDRRRNGRGLDSRAAYEEQQVKYVEFDAESVDSFEVLDDQSEHHDSDESQSLDLLKTYLRKLKKERVKMKRERLEFQRLNTGLQDLLRSWETTDRPMHESVPHTAEGAYFANRHQRSPQFDCPLSAATDPGPVFSYGEPPTPGFATREDAGFAIDRYNQAWTDAKDSSECDNRPIAVPWPTKTLKAGDLSRDEGQPIHLYFEYSTRSLPSEITDDAYHLRKWNAFNFFLASFGLKARYQIDDQHDDDAEDGASLVFDIEPRGASKAKLDKLKSQLLQEKLRWHPDRMKRMRLARFSELDAENAKAVWGAIVDASKAYERCLTATSRQ